MKQMLLVFSIAMLTITTQAQNGKTADFPKGFHLAAGFNAAVPLGDFSDFQSAGVGVEVVPEYRFSRRLSVTMATGYTSFFGKDDFKDVGFIPVIAGLRGYIFPHFFIGSKWGAGILTHSVTGYGNSQVWFNAQPGLGYDGQKLQATVGLNIQRDHGENLTDISVSLLYKIK